MDAKSFRNRCVRAGQIAVGLCIIANFCQEFIYGLRTGLCHRLKILFSYGY